MFNPLPYKDPSFRMPFQCIWLKLNGSWPLETALANQKLIIRSYLYAFIYNVWALYVIISVGITITFQASFLINNFGDIIMTTENCCSTLMGTLNFVRLIHLRLNQPNFRELIKQFVLNIWIPDNENVEIAKECRKRMITFQVMTILLSCLILMYCILPLVELFYVLGTDIPEKPFPYKMIFPYNAHNSWIRYALTYTFTAYAGICVVTTLFAEDSLFGFFITYTCGQFRILHSRIDFLIDKGNTKVRAFGTANGASNLILELQRIALLHNKIIRFAKRLEDFFNPILLVNLMISAVLICMVGFQLVTSEYLFIGDYFKFVVYISSAISQLYILCANGDTLIQHSSITAWHLYNCRWEAISYNREFLKNLKYMILCSQRPIRITAFKFSTLSLQSFTAILSTSMSYFTLLRSIYFDK